MAQNRQIRYVRVVSGSMWQYVAGVPGSCRDFAGGCYYRSSRNYLLLRHYVPPPAFPDQPDRPARPFNPADPARHGQPDHPAVPDSPCQRLPYLTHRPIGPQEIAALTLYHLVSRTIPFTVSIFRGSLGRQSRHGLGQPVAELLCGHPGKRRAERIGAVVGPVRPITLLVYP